jgi:NAD(P)-dependent dehydrogenase (short-subunit alcohol dehydrogenase family)
MLKAFAKGQVAVVTGGASGIGLEAARRCAALGMKVCVADLSGDAFKAWLESRAGHGRIRRGDEKRKTAFD